MPVRHFDGSNDYLAFALGNAALNGAFTAAAIIRRRGTGMQYQGVFLGGDGDNGPDGYSFFLRSGVLTLLDGSGNPTGGPTLSLDEWSLVVATKASGTVTPRYHTYDFDSETWSHSNGTATLPNPSLPTAGNGNAIGIGGFGDSGGIDNDLFADLQAVAVWGSALSDANCEKLSISLEEWLGLSPAGMWVFDQAAVTTAVSDSTGGGADQSARSGTSVVSEDGPIPAESATEQPNCKVNVGGVATNAYMRVNVP